MVHTGSHGVELCPCRVRGEEGCAVLVMDHLQSDTEHSLQAIYKTVTSQATDHTGRMEEGCEAFAGLECCVIFEKYFNSPSDLFSTH